MATINPFRNVINVEELNFRSAVSEGTFQRLGATLNLHSIKQYDTHQFFINGRYLTLQGESGVDGLHVFQFDADLVAVTIFNTIAGASGQTTLDIHWLDTTGDQGSIFTTRPSIDSTAPDDAFATTNLVDSLTAASTGATVPVLNKTQFDQFDRLRIDIDVAMPGAENCGVLIHFRPR